MRPSFYKDRPPKENRGRRECRVPNAPAASCALGVVKYAHEYSQRRHRKHPAFPTQWFYGLYVISPATNSSCHRRISGLLVARVRDDAGQIGQWIDFTYRFQALRPHPEEQAFAFKAMACVSRDGGLHGHRPRPSFETRASVAQKRHLGARSSG